MEEWRDIEDFPGDKVSNFGRVGSCKACKGFGVWETTPNIQRYLTLGQGAYGYQQVTLSRQGKITLHKVHHLVIEAFVGPRPKDMVVCHNNGNPSDNDLSNLRYDTHIANALDRNLHGTSGGLTPEQVLEIRKRIQSGELYKTVAKEYDRNISNVYEICAGKSYSNLPGPIQKTRTYRHSAKLTDKDVQSIRTQYREGALQRILAEKYKISISMVSRIVNNQRRVQSDTD